MIGIFKRHSPKTNYQVVSARRNWKIPPDDKFARIVPGKNKEVLSSEKATESSYRLE